MRVIVLAGGGGTRLWPLSKEDFPKQFLRFGSGPSLLQRTVKRFQKAAFVEEVLICTNALLSPLVEEQLKKIGAPCQILIEPSRKNTAAAIAFAVQSLQELRDVSSSETILVVPSDHLIEPETVFLQTLQKIEPKSHIVTFGIETTRPETGFGYIEKGKRFDALTFQIERFVEKPDYQTAKLYVQNPLFLWNSGMFLFRVETFWHQLSLHAPEIYRYFLCSVQETRDRFESMESKSIDYAVLEKSKDVLVCPLSLSWSDVGSWDSVYEVMEKDENQNVKVGHVFTIDTENSLIIGGKKVISTIGLRDILIVETEDGILISKRGESQKVKDVLEELKRMSHIPHPSAK